MAIAYLFEIPGVTPEQGTAILQELGTQGRPPAGQVLHIEGPMEGGGLRVVDVWESEEALGTFVQTQLMPAVQKVGAAVPPDLQPKAVWPVSNILK